MVKQLIYTNFYTTMDIFQPETTPTTEERLNALERKFLMHNHADGFTQPVWLGKISQGSAYTIIPTTAGVLGEAVSNGSALCIKSDGKIYKASALTQAEVDGFIGIATCNGVAGETANFISFGYKTDYSGLTPGTVYYLSDTPGVLSTTPGTISKKVAIVFSPTTLFIKNF